MADVFISYKSERRAAAEHLAEILADYGYTVWWDYGLISGRDFGAQIEKELRAAKAVVVLWCSMAVQSEWVREEAALAKRLDKIIPTFIEKIELPLGFSLAQTLDLSEWDGAPQSNRLDRLLRDIGQFVGRAPQPNLEGLDRTERAWRRFGAPPLREFALIDALERKLPPRTLPGALHPQQSEHNAPVTRVEHQTSGGARQPRRALVIGGVLAAALAVAAVGFGVSRWLPTPSVETAEEQTGAPESKTQSAPRGGSETQTASPSTQGASTASPEQIVQTTAQPGHNSARQQHADADWILGLWTSSTLTCSRYWRFARVNGSLMLGGGANSDITTDIPVTFDDTAGTWSANGSGYRRAAEGVVLVDDLCVLTRTG